MHTFIQIGKITKNSQIKVPQPIELDFTNDIDHEKLCALSNPPSSSAYTSTIRQLSRITLTIDELNDAHILTSTNETLLKFDIVAVSPGTIEVFTYLCKTAEIDIIALDFTHKIPFQLNKKLIDEAVLRGIHFEIIYSPIPISSSQVRREIFANTRVFIQYLNGKVIILTGGSESLSSLRSPLDVCGIAEALQITKENAIKTITENPALVIKHSQSRRRQYLSSELITLNELEVRYPEIVRSLSQQSQAQRRQNRTKIKETVIEPVIEAATSDMAMDVEILPVHTHTASISYTQDTAEGDDDDVGEVAEVGEQRILPQHTSDLQYGGDDDSGDIIMLPSYIADSDDGISDANEDEEDDDSLHNIAAIVNSRAATSVITSSTSREVGVKSTRPTAATSSSSTHTGHIRHNINVQVKARHSGTKNQGSKHKEKQQIQHKNKKRK